MAGYKGYSMSNNAYSCYLNGIYPISKWTKSKVIERIIELTTNEGVEIKVEIHNLHKLRKDELCKLLLEYDSWHHSSKYFNKIEFYRINQDALEELTDDMIQEIILKRVPIKRVQKEKEEIEYITAYVQFEQWEGTRNHPKKVAYEGVVQYMSNEKIVHACGFRKRLSSLHVIKAVQQKTKYYPIEKMERKVRGN